MLKAFRQWIIWVLSKFIPCVFAVAVTFVVGVGIGWLVVQWMNSDWACQRHLLETVALFQAFRMCGARRRRPLACVDFKSRLIGTLAGRTVVVMMETILRLLGWMKRPLRQAPELHLHRGRPPDTKSSIAVVKERSKVRRRQLFRAIALLVLLPTFVRASQAALESDLKGFVGAAGKGKGFLNTRKLPSALMQRVREDLAATSRSEESIAGLEVGIADTGASAICLSDKAKFVPGTHVEEASTAKLGGIAGGLSI